VAGQRAPHLADDPLVDDEPGRLAVAILEAASVSDTNRTAGRLRPTRPPAQFAVDETAAGRDWLDPVFRGEVVAGREQVFAAHQECLGPPCM
jgi:hypothetical protein